MQSEQKKLDNLNRQLRIQDVLTVLITQSTKLIDIVNANQKEVNRLKAELDQLKILFKVVDKLENRISTLEKVLASHAKCIGEMREEKDE